ncbi:SIP domain-containing protein [Streptomyces sp. NPDC058470]|uniref:SIP domain-containing protein n=1 Tax=Streptomyces sp. NPDC058470 TaxID=3346515 RepID=UPI00365620E6
MVPGHGWEGAVLNSLLDSMNSTPATIWFETDHEPESLPLRLTPTLHDLRPLPRRDNGAHLVAQVKAGLPAPLEAAHPNPYIWIACDTTTTRSLTSYVRKELALPRRRVHALGYWRAT